MPREIETVVYEYENIYTGETFETEEEALESEKDYLSEYGGVFAYDENGIEIPSPYGMINVEKWAYGLGEIEAIIFKSSESLNTFKMTIEEQEREDGCDHAFIFFHNGFTDFPLTFIKNPRWKVGGEKHRIPMFVPANLEIKQLESQLIRIKNLLDKISKQ